MTELSKCNVCAITETWLTENVLSSELFPKGFNVYRRDRSSTCPDTRGGGVLLAIDDSIPSRRRQDLEPQCEIIVCELVPYKSKKVAIILCYRPQTCNILTFTVGVQEALTKVSKEYEHVCMLGDFNLSGVKWTADPIIATGSERTLCDTIAGFSLTQINYVVSNKFGNILDLIFTNVPDLFGEVAEYTPVFFALTTLYSLLK